MVARFFGAGLLLVLLLAGPLHAQDFIKQNPAFEKLYNNLTPQNREQMLKYLQSMTPESRKAFMESMVKMNTDAGKNRVSVERVTAKLLPPTGNDSGLTVISADPKVQPLTSEEIEQLKTLGVRGNLQVETFSTINPEDLLKWPKVRIILIMQRQISSPVEFHMPQQGTLFLVQTYNGWQSAMAGFSESNKTVRIAPVASEPLRTIIDYDIGDGRVSGQAFLWPKLP